MFHSLHVEHYDCSYQLPIKETTLTGIVCTIGPACDQVDTLEQMLYSGMTIARLNLSHGTHKYYNQVIFKLRQAESNVSQKCGYNIRPLVIALDTKGCEIRTGLLEDGPSAEVYIAVGSKIMITTDQGYREHGSNQLIYVDDTDISKALKPDDAIYIDDGLIGLTVIRVVDSGLECEVKNGGMLGSCKGVNIPNLKRAASKFLSPKDQSDLKFGVDAGIDAVFVSFTRDSNDVQTVRDLVGKDVRVFAKIESADGVKNMDEIIAHADGIMVDRGDLGMEIGIENVAGMQKCIISRCNKAAKPIIIATHLLETMVSHPRPTRAECVDVCNAVLDGADAVMLSGETAKGHYPVQCVNMMTTFCRRAEMLKANNTITPISEDKIEAICRASVLLAIGCTAQAIIVINAGHVIPMLAKERPNCGILILANSLREARQLQFFRGVKPIFTEEQGDEADLDRIIRIAKLEKLINASHNIVVLCGLDSGQYSISILSL